MSHPTITPISRRPIAIRLDTELVDRLDVEAAMRMLSRNRLIELLLDRALDDLIRGDAMGRP